MGLESATTIPGLNALWPLGSDAKSEGDDHIRLIKSVLKAEFPAGGVGKTAEARNRIVNGAMQVSQQFGNTAGTTAAGYHGADQWFTYHSTTATMTTQRVQVVTPNGSKDRYRVTVTVADATLTTTEVCQVTQYIEGTRVADFRWGSASAKQVVLRFGWKSPAGTFSVALRNSGSTRSYIANFTITAGQAGTDTEQTFVIPGDTAGTWLTDSSTGINMSLFLANGPTGVGVAGWQGGNLMGTSSNTNGIAAGGAVYELFDVGLYMDPANTGKAPAWAMPDETVEALMCRRYWESGTYEMDFQVTSGSYYGYTRPFQVTKRIAPAITDISSAATNFSTTTFPGSIRDVSYRPARQANGTGAGSATGNWSADARM